MTTLLNKAAEGGAGMNKLCLHELHWTDRP